MRRVLATILSLTLLVGLAACGDSHTAGVDVRPSALVRGQRGYYDAEQLERRLSNAFRAGLYRLAVITQPGEEAADVGQQLPTGKVSGVRCDAQKPAPSAGGAWAWRCEVRWRTVAGAERRTTYAVRLTPDSCFDAEAEPHLAPV